MESPVLVGHVAYHAGIPGPKRVMDSNQLFYRHFEAEVTALQEEVGNLSNISFTGGERKDATDHILSGISRLNNEVLDVSDKVPPRDKMIYNEALKALKEQLNVQTSSLTPKGRFSFKPRTQNVPPSADPRLMQNIPDESSAVSSANTDSLGNLPTFTKNYNAEMSKRGAGIRQPSFSAAHDIAITDHKGLHIILPSTASAATSSGSLTDLEGCIVDMSKPTANGTPFANLVLKNITKSLIISGHVDGSAHITGIKDSILVVNARQVRIHECRNVDIYLYCMSHPIIEDCSGMRFAPIPSSLLLRNEDPAKNQWNQVDDFKWLKSEHSPNWEVLPEAEQISEDTWKNTVPGGPGLSTEDVLNKVGSRGR